MNRDTQQPTLIAFISSSDDVAAERTQVMRAVNAVSVTALPGMPRIIPFMWEDSTDRNITIGGPQKVVDSSMRVEDCEVVIGIIGSRIGPGTEDELKRAISVSHGTTPGRIGKLLVCFKQNSISDHPADDKELEKISKLRAKMNKYDGLTANFTTEDELRLFVQVQLYLYLQRYAASTNQRFEESSEYYDIAEVNHQNLIDKVLPELISVDIINITSANRVTLETFVSHVWQAALGDLSFADKLLRFQNDILALEIKACLGVVVKLCALGLVPSNDELCKCLQFLSIVQNAGIASKSTPLLYCRIIKSTLYAQPSLMESENIISQIKGFVAPEVPYTFQLAMSDIYLRFKHRRLSLPAELFHTVQSYFNQLTNTNSSDPLVAIDKLLTSQFIDISEKAPQTFKDDLKNMLLAANHEIHVNWILYMFFARLGTKNNSVGFNVDKERLFLELLDSIKSERWKSSAGILMKKMICHLRIAVFDRSIAELRKFMTVDSVNRPWLHPKLRIMLDLEFMAANYLVAGHRDSESDWNNTPVHTALSGNINSLFSIIDETVFKEAFRGNDSANRLSMLTSMRRYLLYRQQRESFLIQVDDDPFLLNDLVLTRFAVGLQDVVKNRLHRAMRKRLDSAGSNLTPEQAAFLIRLAFFLKSADRNAMLPHLVQLAIRADADILQHISTELSYACYASVAYSQNSGEIEGLLLSVKNNLIENWGEYSIASAWIYCATMNCEEGSDLAFLMEIGHKASELSPIGLRARTDVGADYGFSTSLIDIIDHYVNRKSYLSSAAHNNMNNAELWNMYGTQLRRIAEHAGNTAIMLTCASGCYGLAVMLEENRGRFEIKYYFNYIRTISEAHLHSNTHLPSSLVLSIIDFLANDYRAREFSYWKDCLTPFVDALTRDRRSLTARMRPFFDKIMRNKKWAGLFSKLAS